MANPLFIEIEKDKWTKIATGVLTGIVHKVKSTPDNYMQTYRLTGESAPTLKSDGVLLFSDSQNESIESSEEIDVYLLANGADGEVRVDL